MKEPILVVLAAGMGSRFGGLKQITPMDEHGHAIIDFSLYDAYKAGFRRVVFIIKHEIEADFKDFIGYRMEKYFEVKYVDQEIDMLPDGFAVPEGRKKPWGTGHAVISARDVIDAPFAVINSDDFYGRGAYTAMYDFLSHERPANEHSMLGYLLKNTVTENGSVARGVCVVKDGLLTDIVERTHIEKRGEDAAFTLDGENFTPLSGTTPVSMNFWGFGLSMMDELVDRFSPWLEQMLKENPIKAEYFLPIAVDKMIKEGTGSVKVLDCHETWHGVTYHEDMPEVVNSLKKMRSEGIYPEALLD